MVLMIYDQMLMKYLVTLKQKNETKTKEIYNNPPHL